MVKVFTVEQIRAADQYTIDHEPISSTDLMERAATRAYEWIVDHYPNKHTHFSVFCGTGNNGGDGLVIARLLKEEGYSIDVFSLQLGSTNSADYDSNLKRLKAKVNSLKEANYGFQLKDSTVVIDAIFGTGLSRAVKGFAKAVIQEINSAHKEVVAIDIPSGLFAEENPDPKEIVAIHASYTLTFQFPKLALFFPQNQKFVGDWQLINIGLHPDYIAETDTKHFLFTQKDARSILKKRSLFSHKGDYGRAFILAGSKGKMGAALLAAKACMRAGAGLLTVQIPEVGYQILQSQLPEAMVETDSEINFLSELKKDIPYSAIGVGPGIGMEQATQDLLKMIIQQSAAPLVLDADALNILSENKTWLSFLPAESILSPHPGEFKRLVGDWSTDSERLELQTDFSRKHGIYTVLKGRFTSISCPDGRIYFNPTGNPGMATGGSGDVLTGIITSFLAQGYASEQAAILGVYMHGLAGDLAAEALSEESMIAGDIVDFLSKAFRAISG